MLTSSYPRHNADNSSIFLRYLATNIANHNVDIHVLAPHHRLVDNSILDINVKNHWFRYLPKQWQRLAYSSGILPNLKRNKLLYLQVPFFLSAMLVSLFLLCKKIKPDAIHAQWVFPQGFIAIIVGKLLKIPVIATAHGGDAFSLNTDIIGRLKALTLKHCHGWTSNTKATAETFDSSNNIQKPTLIPMGVDVKHFQSGIADKLIDTNENKKVVLFVGRLVEKKGIKYLIEAFSMLPKKTQNASVLWIIGDGDERISLENQAKLLGIQNIKFWGHIQNKYLPNFYAAASMFVAPSIIDSKGDTEGQGIILLEAMASKTPVIATTVGGIPEVITHKKTGILVPPKDSKELSAAIKHIFDNKICTDEYIKNAFINVNNIYSWKSISQQFISKFNKIIIKNENLHRDGFSATTNRDNKAKKILTVLAKELLVPVENKLILDIGTGNGDIASFIGKKNTVISVDISDFRQNKDNYYFSRCNASLPFKAESFDAVISNHVIEHIINQTLHINEIKRVLKNDGVLYLATPNKLWPFEVHYRLFLLHYLPHKLFLKILKKTGRYKEDVFLLSCSRIYALLGKINLTSYSGAIIQAPKQYSMPISPYAEKALSYLPSKFIDLTIPIHPTFIFTYKKPNVPYKNFSKSD
jgi:teichuronic acid biosynthesis glycosyltransferase TuaC